MIGGMVVCLLAPAPAMRRYRRLGRLDRLSKEAIEVRTRAPGRARDGLYPSSAAALFHCASDKKIPSCKNRPSSVVARDKLHEAAAPSLSRTCLFITQSYRSRAPHPWRCVR